MKLFKKTAALMLCILLVIACFAGCHGKDATVATSTAADGSIINVPSGVYLAMLLNADSEARNLVIEQLGDKATDDINYAKQTVKVDDTTYKFYDYVNMRVEQTCRDYITTHYLFLKNKCTLTEAEENTMSSYVQYQWAYSGGAYLYQPNGVSFDSFEQYMRVISYELSNLFDFYYEDGGEKAPAADVITKGLEDNFVVANVIEITTKDSDGKTLTEEKLRELEAKLQGYADRINGGEEFKKVNDEYEAEKKAAEEEAKKEEASSNAASSSAASSTVTSSAATSSAAASSNAASSAATSSDAASSTATSSATTSSGVTDPTKPQPKDSLAKLYGSADSLSSASDLFDEFKKLEIGKATVVKGTDGYYRMVLRKDIHDDEYYLSEYSNEVLRILYSDEFEKFIEDEGKKLTVTYNDYEKNYLKPKKIDYSEYQAWYSSMTQQYQ